MLNDFLIGLIQHSGWRLTFTLSEQAGVWQINFMGEDAGLLLARGAEVLNAIEHLVERILAHHAPGRWSVRLDANGYRANRERELVMMARTAAEQVRKYRQPFTFSALSAAERRIIHLTLAADPSVRTESIGYGDERKVVVHPV
ncbi:MAG: R3H domain-containing nucleic acid-binding protein [Chloracidobacterium sp.]